MRLGEISIRKGSIEEAVNISQRIPEFDQPHSIEVYQSRLKGKKHLIAVAEVEGELAGFKVGYDKFGDARFYTWMGGVLPKFRKHGVARQLANFQEDFILAEGFNSVVLKTRNRHKNMLHFAISSGFEIIEVDLKSDSSENRIILEKQLK